MSVIDERSTKAAMEWATAHPGSNAGTAFLAGIEAERDAALRYARKVPTSMMARRVPFWRPLPTSFATLSNKACLSG